MLVVVLNKLASEYQGYSRTYIVMSDAEAVVVTTSSEVTVAVAVSVTFCVAVKSMIDVTCSVIVTSSVVVTSSATVKKPPGNLKPPASVRCGAPKPSSCTSISDRNNLGIASVCNDSPQQSSRLPQ